MKQLILILSFVQLANCLCGQTVVSNNITAARAKQHLEWLASDSLKGRGNGTGEIWQAAEYIAELYKKAGLQPLPGFASYFHPFMLNETYKVPLPVLVDWGGADIKESEIQWFGCSPLGREVDGRPARTIVVHTDSAFHRKSLLRNWPKDADIILWTEKRPKKKKWYFPEMFDMPPGGLDRNILLVYADKLPDSISISANPAYLTKVGHNVVGLLPGGGGDRINLAFGAHYDHVGRISRGEDRIMNGANDNASGTTALLLLAEYFGTHQSTNRNLLFMAFAGEEMGLFGSTALVKDPLLPPVNRMLNLEMLGIPQYGAKSVFITGEGRSDFSRRLARELKNAGLNLVNEPNKERMLFQRSDNFSFAEKGIPAHTIMASDDLDACYHKPCDEATRIDFDNLAAIVLAIAEAATTMLWQ